MASDEELLKIFRATRTIAVVGASMHDHKPSHAIPRYLQEQGYRIVPVNPRGGRILGERVHRSLQDVDVAVDAVELFRPPEEAERVAREAIAIGAKVLWFQPGTHSEEAVRLASAAGLTVVFDHCMEPVHRRLGLERHPAAQRRGVRGE